jgi:hypothetical protein
MGELLREMDHGPAALPPGSEVTLFNTSATEDVVKRVKFRNRLRNLTIRHVYGNPLDYDEVSQRLDVPRWVPLFLAGFLVIETFCPSYDKSDSQGRNPTSSVQWKHVSILSTYMFGRCVADQVRCCVGGLSDNGAALSYQMFGNGQLCFPCTCNLFSDRRPSYDWPSYQ